MYNHIEVCWNYLMRRIARLRIIILVLVLATSHVALMNHVSSHFVPVLEKCQLCVSQAQLQAGIPSPDQGFAFTPGFVLRALDSAPSTVPVQYFNAYHPRAPPLTSA
jgi:hypothetical protein